MKKLLAILSIPFCFNVNATNYYVSNTGNDSNSGLVGFPWLTISKVNGFAFAAGDIISFNKGGTWREALICNRNGSSGNPITFNSYGSGVNPIITGFASVSAWSNLGSNIWESTSAASTLSTCNMVVINGNKTGMGRYPNTGYLTYQSHVSNTSITSSSLTGTPNWTGAEAVIRKVRWILDRQPITAQSGGTLTITATSPYGDNTRQPVNGNGFFIQNDARTLDTLNEWYYNPSTKKIRIYSTSSPANVQVSTIDNLVDITSKSYITFSDIDFTGSNLRGIYMQGAANITFNSCNFRQHGGTAIYANTVASLTVSGGIITDVFNNGIWVETGGTSCLINGVMASNIGTVAGAARSGDGAQEAIEILGNNTTITNCSVINTGYLPINFNGSNALIEHNFVDTFCTVKDDGGGIYTYESSGVVVANRIVRNNTVLNAIGAFAGAESYYYEAYGKAAGVYLDGSANHTEVSSNTLAHGEWGGIFINSTKDNQILNNTVYDFAQQLSLVEYAIGTIRNTPVSGNKFIARTAAQKTMFIHMYANDNPNLFGTFNNNYYARPIDDNATINIDREYSGGVRNLDITLATWKSTYSQDASSNKSPKTITDVNDLRFEYNETASNKVIALPYNSMDITGATYSGTITLAPYTSSVLIKNGAAGGCNCSALGIDVSNLTAQLTSALARISMLETRVTNLKAISTITTIIQ